MVFSREQRVVINSKEQAVSSGDVKGTLSHSPSTRNMDDGEQVYARQSNKPLALYKKFKGVLWKSYFSKDGDQIIDRDLKVNRNLTVNGDITVKGIPYYTNLPAFSVWQGTASDDETYASGEFTKVTFDNEIYDIGGNFSSSKFTAPVNGIYTFSAKVLFDNGGDDTFGDWDTGERHDIYLYKNESSNTPSNATANRVAGEIDIISGSLIDQVVMNSITVDLKLNKDDYIAVHVYQNSGHDQKSYSNGIDDWTQFSGRLVTAI